MFIQNTTWSNNAINGLQVRKRGSISLFYTCLFKI